MYVVMRRRLGRRIYAPRLQAFPEIVLMQIMAASRPRALAWKPFAAALPIAQTAGQRRPTGLSG